MSCAMKSVRGFEKQGAKAFADDPRATVPSYSLICR